jgi:MSHA biogenesis protein MshN
MSLINQMLQDLDKRGADAVAADPLYSQIRTVTSPPSRRAWRWAFFPMALLGGAVAWLVLAEFLPKLKTRQAAIPVIANQAAPVVLASSKTLTVTASQTTASPPESAMPSLPDLPLLLKLSSGLDKNPISIPLAPEKIVTPIVVAKVERLSPENGELSEKSKSVQSQSLVKSAEQNTAVIKLIKETTPQQQAEAEYRQATVLQQQGRAGEAISMLEQTLKSDFQHTAARHTLISLLLEAKRHEDTMRWLQQWLNADRNQPGMAMILARLQVEKGLTPGAIETLQRSLPHAQDKPDYLAFMAALQQRLSHHKEAADLYREALKRLPQNAVWLMGLGISLQADGRNQEALDAYRQAKGGNGLSPELLAFVEQKITQLQR